MAKWVQRACEMRLRALETGPGGDQGTPEVGAPDEGTPVPPRAPASRVGDASDETPASAARRKKAALDELKPPPAEDPPTAADERSLAEGMPTAVQLAGKEGVTVALARRWLESGEWALYWP